MTRLQSLFIYFSLSVFTLMILSTITSPTNYAWFGEDRNSDALAHPLRYILLFKSIFWLIIVNSIIFIVSIFRQSQRKKVLTYTTALCLFFLLFNSLINRICAPHYYQVFQNQTVAEEYINTPLQKAGVAIAPILVKNIDNKNMINRRYAIQQLAYFKYVPARNSLSHIMNDTTEDAYIREDAHQALLEINK